MGLKPGGAGDTNELKYYQAYEERYQSVYGQGVKYWSDFPQEVEEDLAGLNAFLEFAGARAGTYRARVRGRSPGLRRVLKPGSHVLFNELYQKEGAYSGPVESYEQYLEVFKPDLTTVEERIAYNEGREVKVRIPRVPARPKDHVGYAREMEDNGFRMVHFEVLGSYTGCRFHVQRK